MNKYKRVKKDNFKFLVFTLLETKIFTAYKFSITPSIGKISPYINKEKYLEFKAKIAEKRTKKSPNNNYVLYNRQKGKCVFCNRPMKLESLGEKTKLESQEIHYIKPLSIGNTYKGYSENKALLHESCHKRIHQILEKK